MLKLILALTVALGCVVTTYMLAGNQAADNQAAHTAADILVIRDARLIDGTGRPPAEHASIVIAGNRVQQIFRDAGEARIPNGARVIDAGGRTILPGLIDAHVHLIIGSAGSANAPSEYMPERVIRDLRADLYWGVTTVRSAGDMLDWSVRLRDNERNGTLVSPRLYIVGPMITAVDGHPARFLPPMIAGEATRQVTDEQNTKDVIAELAARKVDMIKLIYDGGSQWETFPKLSLELMKVAIEAAHRSGLRVSVHTWTTSDLKDAIRAGADGVEHGATDELDQEAINLMRERKTFYCPTLAVHLSHARSVKDVDDLLAQDDVRFSVSRAVRQGLATHTGYAFEMKKRADLNDYFQKALLTSERNTRLAVENGVRVALGTDAGEPVVFHGLAVHDELRLMVASGVSPMQALIAATRTAAEYLGQAETLGTLEAGKLADLLIVDGDPLKEITATKRVWQVIKSGQVIDRARLLSEERE